MVAYVHIEYSIYQFSEETKGGWNQPPPPSRSLRYWKKCGPERVKYRDNSKVYLPKELHLAEYPDRVHQMQGRPTLHKIQL